MQSGRGEEEYDEEEKIRREEDKTARVAILAQSISSLPSHNPAASIAAFTL